MEEYVNVTSKDIVNELEEYIRTVPRLSNIDLSGVGRFNLNSMRALIGKLGRLGKILMNELIQQKLAISDESRIPKEYDVKKYLMLLFGIDEKINADRFGHCMLEILQIVVVEGSDLYLRSNVKGIYQPSDILLKRIIIRLVNYIKPNTWSENQESIIIGQLIRLAPSMKLADFNKHHFIVGEKALNLDTVEIEDINDSQLCTFRSEYTPVKGNTTVFDSYLSTTFDDENISQFIYEWFGSNLDSSRANGSVLFCVSSGASGKSTLLNVIRKLVGVNNVCGPTIQSLGNQFGLQPLYNKCSLITDESSGANFPTATIKSLCTGTQQTIDRKYLSPIEVTLPITMSFAFNIVPIAEDTIGFERRLLYLNFPHVFLNNTSDKNLGNKIDEELNAILFKSIQGLKRVRENNGSFTETAQMLDDKHQYLNKAKSPVELFLKDVGETKVGISTSKNKILESFNAWLKYRTMPSNGFNIAQRFWPEARRVWPQLFHSKISESSSHSNRVINDFVIDDSFRISKTTLILKKGGQ